MTARTSDKLRVRRAYITGSLSSAATEINENEELASFTAQDDIRIIGLELEGELQTNTSHLEDGQDVRMATWFSVGSPSDLSARLLQVHLGAHQHISAGGQMESGSRFERADVQFPDRHGIDIDEGDSVYLYGTNRNQGAGGITVHLNGIGIIYYVER